MKFRRSQRRAAITIAGATAIAVWLHPNVLDFGYHGDTVAIAAPEATSADLASLLNQVKVVDHIDSVPGYERSCKKGQAPLTELTARFGQVWMGVS